MKLSELPANVFGRILGFQRTSSALLLYKCGDRALNRTLLSVEDLSITLKDYNPRSTSRFPKLLTTLPHLRELILIRPQGTVNHHVRMSILLRGLPSTLEVIKFDFTGAGLVLLDYIPKRNLDRSPCHFHETTHGKTRLWNVATTFPHLTTLKLRGERRMPRLDWSAADCSRLPHSLTTFHVDYLKLGRDGRTLRALPRKMRDLKISIVLPIPFVDEEVLKHLPPNLTRLRGITFIDAGGLALLPRTLKFMDEGFFTLVMLPENIKALPPTLTRLQGDIKSLRIEDASSTSILSLYSRNLTKLDILTSWCEPLAVEDIKALPRGLKHFGWESTVDFTSFEDHTTNEIKNFWPSTLTSLSFSAARHLPVSNATYVGCFPKTLVRLSHINLMMSGERLLSAFSNFAPNLKHLIVTIPSSYDKEYTKHPKLPVSLKSFKVNIWRSEWLRKLKTPNLARLCIDSLYGSEYTIRHDLRDLPPTLTHLDIGYTNLRATNRCPNLLTPLTRLRHLRIGSESHFDLDIIPKLPRTLTYLDIELFGMRRSDVKFLPPNLISLRIGGMDLPAHLANGWPIHTKCIDCGPLTEELDRRAAAFQSLSPHPKALSIS